MAGRVATRIFIIGVLAFCLFLFTALNTSADDRDWGNLTNGDVYLFYCSHQDLGWEDSYHDTKAKRNQYMIEPVVGWAKNHSDYKYCIEYTRAAMDFKNYTQTTEGKEALWQDFVNLVKSGQIEVGGTYNCGYESLFSGEGLVRQTYLGRKWLRDLGCDTEVAWNVDPPIRSLQTAQIYRKAGIKYMMDSRYKKGFFKWKSPNVHEGSDDYSFIVYSQGTYDHPWVYFIRNATCDPYLSVSGYNGVLYPYSFNKKDSSDNHHPDSNSIDYVLDYANLYRTRNDNGQWPNDANNTNPWAWEAWDDYYNDFGGSGSELTGILPFYYSTDMGMPRCYIASPGEQYNSTLLYDWAENKTVNDPTLHLVTGKEALDAVVAAAQDQNVSFKEWQGELPNTWAYIHGPGHYQLITKMRSAQRLLPAAEMFTAFNNILEGSLYSYPESTFTEAWGKAIFPDHGMGGEGIWYSDNYPDVEGDDDVVDVAMWVRVKDAEKTADEHLANATTAIANRIQFTQTADEPVPIVVFNTLSWQRSDPVICTVTPGSSTWGIIDADGHGVAHQVLSTNGDSKEIVFLAEDVPSLGYKTYYLVHRNVSMPDTETGLTHTDTSYENDYYEVGLTTAGIQSIEDKDTGQTLLQSKAYQSTYYQPGTNITLTPFELFTMHSAYDENYLYFDAGTFPEVPPAGLDSTFVQAKDQANWTYNATESGAVRDVYSFTKELNEVDNWWATVTQKLIFYRELKRIDCEITLTNWGRDGKRYALSDDKIKMREWRMALPLAFSGNKARVTYEVPMGTVLVGRDEVQDSLGAWYYYDAYNYSQMPEPPAPENQRPVKASYMHPREVQNFVSVSDGDYGVTMSSCVSVCDYIFPSREQDNIKPDAEYNIANPMIQPILLATRKSNGWNSHVYRGHGLYSQRGDHTFTFSVLSHVGDWSSNSLRGARFAMQANNPLRAVALSGLASGNSANTLDETKSFCSVSPDNVLVTAFKKKDGDSNNVIVRMYDILGGRGTYNSTLNFFFNASSTKKTNIIEEYSAEGNLPTLSSDKRSVTIDVGHHSIETLALQPSSLSPCYIATASYGTPLHEDIDVLRNFRDEYLMTNPIGRGVVKIYYTTSPPIADVIRNKEELRLIIRESLIKPLVNITKMFMNYNNKDDVRK